MNNKNDKTIAKSDTQSKQAVFMQATKLHVGPLPSPEDFASYENTCAGSSGRLLTMAEKEQDAIIKKMNRDYILRMYGLWFGFFVFCGLLVLIGYGMYVNQPWISGVLIAAITGCGLFLKYENK